MLGVTKKVYANSGNQAVIARVPERSVSILDIGCGAGDNARALRDSATSRRIVGVTGSEREAALAREVCDDVHVCNLEHGLPNFAGSKFDVVICSHVLEHICFPSQLLSDAHAVMENDARMIVALPNLMYYKSRVKLLLGKFQYQDSGVMDYTHFRWYTFLTAQDLLRENGFDVLEASTCSSVPLPFLRRILPHLVTSALDNCGGRVSPGLFGHQLMFVCKSIDQ